MQDGFTKYAQCFPIRNKEATTTAQSIIDHWISQYGCPAALHSDQGTEFKNQVWVELCDRLQIKKTTTPGYSPQSNLVERWHRVLNAIMRIYLEREDPGWLKVAPLATLAYNTKVHSTTGVSPFEAWYGRRARLPVDLIMQTPDKQYDTADAYIVEAQDRFSQMFKWMRANGKATFHRNAKFYSGRFNTYKPDDLVWVFCSKRVPGKSLKLTDCWQGPWKCVDRVADVLISVVPALQKGRKRTVHITRCAPYLGPKDGKTVWIQDEAVLDDMGDELAEEIGGERDIEDDLITPVQRSELKVPVVYAPEPQEMMKDVAGASRLPLMPLPIQSVPVKKPLVEMTKRKRGMTESLELEFVKKEKKKKKTKSIQAALSVRTQPKRRVTEEIHPAARTEKKKKYFEQAGGEKRKPEGIFSDGTERERKRKTEEILDTDSTSMSGSVMSSGDMTVASTTATAATSTTSRRKTDRERSKLKIKEERPRSRSSQRKDTKLKYKDFAASTITTSDDEDAEMRVTEKKPSRPKTKYVRDAHLRTPLPSDHENDDIVKVKPDKVTKLVIQDEDTITIARGPVSHDANTCAAVASQPTVIPITSGSIPTQRTDSNTGAARKAWDIRTDTKIQLPANKTTPVDLELSLELHPDLALLVLGQTGLTKHGLHVKPLVIDCKTRDKIQLHIHNHNPDTRYLTKGQRIATCFVIGLLDATFVLQSVQETELTTANCAFVDVHAEV